MRKRNVLTALAVVAATLQLIGGAGPAPAQTAPDLKFTRSPASGPPGTIITFTGTGCPLDATKTFDGVVFLTQGNTNTPLREFRADAPGAFSVTYDTTLIAPGTYTTFATCTNTNKGGPGEAFTVTPPPGARYHPLVPARVLDTRDGTGTGVVAPVGADGTIDVKVTGAGGVPATGVSAVVLNVTATNATAYSYLTVWPAGLAKPPASNVNFYTGPSTPNLVQAKVGADGKVSIYNIFGTVDVLADVQGWYDTATDGSTYVPVDPARVLDTRNGTGAPTAKVGPDGTIDVKVTDGLGVPPAGVTAVVLNVTATNASSTESYITVYPAASAKPNASNLNFVSGQHTPNLVIARVGDGGKVTIFNKNGSVDVVADVQGYFTAPGTSPPGSGYFATSPVRVLDTRDGTGIAGGETGQLGEGASRDLVVAGVAGVPAGATAVVLNMAVADSFGPASYLTVYPSGTARPLASNLNWAPGQTRALLVIARVANGKVTIYNNLGSTNVIADVQGWYTTAP